MRTLYEIITEAKDGGMPTHEECYWAILALDAAATHDKMMFQREMMKDPPSAKTFREMFVENSFKMWKALLNQSPKDWLGPEHDPSKPENQRFRKIALNLFDKAMKGELPNQKGRQEVAQ